MSRIEVYEAPPDEPPALYAWDVTCGKAGVTDDPDAAMAHVAHALRTGVSGARGELRQVALAPSGHAKYVDVRRLGEAWLDETSGIVTWAV